MPSETLLAGIPSDAITLSGLALPENLTTAERESVGHALLSLRTFYRWALADFLAYADARGELEKFASLLGVTPKTARRWANVARRIAPATREARMPLFWSHHAAVASLSASDQARWLSLAAESRLSVPALRAAIARDGDGKTS